MWIEMRCENRHEPNADDCCAHHGDNGLLTHNDTHKEIMETVRALEESCKKSGYKKIKNEWYCYECVAKPDFKPQHLIQSVEGKQ